MNYDDYNSHQAGVCPVCESLDIKYGSFCLDDCGGYYEAECSACGTKFHEVYTFEFFGHYRIRRGEKNVSKS